MINCKMVLLLKVLFLFFVDTYKDEVQEHHGELEGDFIQKHSQTPKNLTSYFDS